MLIDQLYAKGAAFPLVAVQWVLESPDDSRLQIANTVKKQW